MDAQKISEAASTIKKADLALAWLSRIGVNIDGSDVKVSTQGNATAISGHGEVTPYLRAAFEQYRDSILGKAEEMAHADKMAAQNAIRVEVDL